MVFTELNGSENRAPIYACIAYHRVPLLW